MFSELVTCHSSCFILLISDVCDFFCEVWRDLGVIVRFEWLDSKSSSRTMHLRAEWWIGLTKVICVAAYDIGA